MSEESKKILAENLAKFRKEANLTQYELAEKLNYSDKAVSKWERGEAVPDVFVLKQIADLYGTTIDVLLSKYAKIKIRLNKKIFQTRFFISSVSFVGVWFLFVIAYFILRIAVPSFKMSYLMFIYAIPVSVIVLLVLSGIWKNLYFCLTSSSITVWTVALAIYLSITQIDLVFILCVPIQIIIFIVFGFLILRKRQNTIKVNKKSD